MHIIPWLGSSWTRDRPTPSLALAVALTPPHPLIHSCRRPQASFETATMGLQCSSSYKMGQVYTCRNADTIGGYEVPTPQPFRFSSLLFAECYFYFLPHVGGPQMLQVTGGASPLQVQPNKATLACV